ncbi:hypothetical protein R1sor_013461 [Riccia sorocarpa]|uniref:Uncharacterized protein n=1 Tax=Riccia sorocarpa TaxID=122646 RepID=A0ABD3H6M1_9MARC
MAENKGRVHPACINASNPYHECVEYCFRRIAEKQSQAQLDESAVTSSPPASSPVREDPVQSAEEKAAQEAEDKAAQEAEEKRAAEEYAKMSDKQKKLFDLRLKLNAARKANEAAKVAEKKREEAPQEVRGVSKAKWFEERQKRLGKVLETNGLDMKKAYMLDTQEQAEQKYEKWEKKPAAFGWDVFNQKSLYNAYKKRSKNIPYGMEDYNKAKEEDPEFFRDGSSLQYGKTPDIPEENVDRMVDELNSRSVQRKEFSRRRKFHEEKDIDSINDRNEHFNRQLSVMFDRRFFLAGNHCLCNPENSRTAVEICRVHFGEEGSQIKSSLGKDGVDEGVKKSRSKSSRRKPRSREAAEVEVEKSAKSKPKKSAGEKVLTNDVTWTTGLTVPNGTPVVTHNPSTDEAPTKTVSPNSSQGRRREDEVKTLRRSRRAKGALPDGISSPPERINYNHTKSAISEAQDHPPGEGLKSKTSGKGRKRNSEKAADSRGGRTEQQERSKSATSVKESKYDEVAGCGDGSAVGQEESIIVIPGKGRRKSKSAAVSNQGDESGVQPEIALKLRKSKKENRSGIGDNSAQISEKGSKTKKKKKKKSRRKTEEIIPAETCGTFGLNAMIEPWALLETVAKQHRDEVHVLKDIMDLHAARTGDKSKLQQLQKLLMRIDKRNIPTPSETSSAISEPMYFSPPLSMKPA